MKITVTRRDIAGGLRNDSAKCPVATALHRKLKRPLTVGFLEAHVEGCQVIRLPFAAREFIESFDKGEVTRPFAFVIRELEEAK